MRNEDVRRIGIFRALYLGDMLCIIPTVRAIRAGFPRAKITLIGLPWEKDFVQRYRHYFDDFLEFKGWPGLPERTPVEAEVIEFLSEVRNYNFDLLFQMQGNGVITNSMCTLWGAKKVCGLRTNHGYEPYRGFFPVSEDDDHEVLRFLKLLAPFDIHPVGTHLEFPLHEHEIATAANILHDLDLSSGNFICIHPGARDPRRRWSPASFAWVAQHLIDKGYKILLTGSFEEAELLEEVQGLVPSDCVNLVQRFGHVGIGELAAIIDQSALLVSNDTGVSHVASAMQHYSVIVFSPFSDRQRWAPLDQERHRIIGFESAGNPATVLQAALEQLESAVKNTHAEPTGAK